MTSVARAPDVSALQALAAYVWSKVIIGKHIMSLAIERVFVWPVIGAGLQRCLFNGRLLVWRCIICQSIV
ncbi:MAG: hypothetical protein GVY25_10315 [Bacteroidetes bacterium]|jgi:hypothetical protein|nr:hypothetical protein [Bacteroidota bacterium]